MVQVYILPSFQESNIYMPIIFYHMDRIGACVYHGRGV